MFGLAIACLAVFSLELTLRTFIFWLSRADYVRTEFKVTELHIGIEGDPMVWGTVAATGEELRLVRVPSELYEATTPNGPISTVISPEAAQGRVVPIWFARGHQSLFSSPRVQFVSEFETLPSALRVLGVAALSLRTLTLGLGCAWVGLRRIRASANGS